MYFVSTMGDNLHNFPTIIYLLTYVIWDLQFIIVGDFFVILHPHPEKHLARLATYS